MWEYFNDPAYYDMWAVRKVGENDFNKTVHVATKDEAEYVVGILNGKSNDTQTND